MQSVDVVPDALEPADLREQLLLVPCRKLVRFVIGNSIGPRVLLGQVGGDLHRDRLEPELERGLEPGMPDHHHHVPVHHNGLPEAVTPDKVGHHADRRLGASRVPGVRLDLGRR